MGSPEDPRGEQQPCDPAAELSSARHDWNMAVYEVGDESLAEQCEQRVKALLAAHPHLESIGSSRRIVTNPAARAKMEALIDRLRENRGTLPHGL